MPPLLLLLLAWAPSLRAAPLFSAPSQLIDAGDGPTSVAIGDFNRDGRPDLAVATYDASPPGNVAVLLGNGDGTFGARTEFEAGTWPRALKVADLNGDGRLDLAFVNAGISVMLGNGDGTFQPRNDVFSRSGSLEIADLNGDGRLDLAVSNGGISVLLGNGDGTFQASSEFGAGSGAGGLAIGDLNGDGRLDLVATNGAAEPGNSDYDYVNAALVWLGNGDGTFGPVTGFGTGNRPSSVAIADFNADGRPDVAFTNSEDRSTSVSVLLGNGDGTLGFQLELTAGATPSFVAVADLDADERPDLAVANLGADPDFDSNTVSVLLGNGDGTFRTTGEFYVEENPTSIAIADLDADGRLDLAAAAMGFTSFGGVSVLLGNGDGTFGTDQVATGYGPLEVATADLNGDGRKDLVTANAGAYPGNAGTVSVLLGNGDGTFLPRTDFGAGYYPSSVAIADLNGDARPDLAVANRGSYPNTMGTVSVLLGNGDGTFGARTAFPAGNDGCQPSSVAIADLNGDARPDLAVTNDASNQVAVLLGNGDGTFGAPTGFATGGRPNWVSLADLNADGRQDMVIAAYHPFTVLVFLGNGDGTFAAGTEFPVGRGTLSVAIADFNRDGRLDLAVGHFDMAGRSLLVLLGNGDGTFRTGPDLAAGNDPYSVVAADFNMDGRPDLAVPNDDLAGSVSVLLGNGDGTFAGRVRFGIGNHPNSIACADLNGDGRPDLAAANTNSNSVSVLLANADLPTPVQMSLVSVESTPERVVLRWWGEGAGSLGASVYRSDDANEWVRLGDAIADGADLVHYEDQSVIAGARHAYRLGYREGAAETFTDEVWVDVPAALRFALEGFRPNPALGASAVAFTLMDDSPATIEVLDLAGRRVLRREVGGLGVGRHLVPLETSARLAPGAYLVRLRQAGRTLSARGVVVR